MKQVILWSMVFLSFAIVLALASARADDARTSRIYARAHLSEVQNEGRKDLMAGLIPYVVISVSLIAGVTVVIALTFALISITAIWINRPQVTRPTHTIETQYRIETRTILILQPGEHSRREVYKLIGENSESNL